MSLRERAVVGSVKQWPSTLQAQRKHNCTNLLFSPSVNHAGLSWRHGRGRLKKNGGNFPYFPCSPSSCHLKHVFLLFMYDWWKSYTYINFCYISINFRWASLNDLYLTNHTYLGYCLILYYCFNFTLFWILLLIPEFLLLLHTRFA